MGESAAKAPDQVLGIVVVCPAHPLGADEVSGKCQAGRCACDASASTNS